jgi:predicted Zn-dependent protease
MIERGATDPFVHYAHAMELRSLGRLDEGLEALREVIARFPDYVPSYLMAGQVATELERVEDARALLSEGSSVAQRVSDAHALSELRSALVALDL